MIFSHYREKASDKAQHPFTIKVLKKGIEGTHLNTIKVTYDKPIANVMPNEGKLRALPLKSKPKEGCLLVYFCPIQWFKALARAMRWEKGWRWRVEGCNWKGGGQFIAVYRWHDITPRPWRPLDLSINPFSKLVGNKFNTQKLACTYKEGNEDDPLIIA